MANLGRALEMSYKSLTADLEGNITETVWLSPELGVPVKIERNSRTVRDGVAVKGDQEWLLQSYPP
jgi:hypothetical protein